LLLVASALAAATLGEDAGKRLLRVYPTEAVRNDRSAAAEYELTIDPEGKLEKCAVLRAVGDEQLAAQTCAIIRSARFRFTRASAPDGTPVHGVIRTTSKFYLPDTTLGRAIRDQDFSSLDVDVSVQSLPDGIDDPATFKVASMVDRDGKVVACEPAPDVRDDLADAACGQVQAQVWATVQDSLGAAVPHVREFVVRFTAEQQGG
jgi:TonB family protein